jgi:RNA polymerase sigma-70 factor (ECF subfamily)
LENFELDSSKLLKDFSSVKEKNRYVDFLMKAVSLNVPKAIEYLFETIYHDLYTFALSKLNNEFDADDIAQETFIKIYYGANKYKSGTKPFTWIFKIEINIICDFIEKKRRELYCYNDPANQFMSNDRVEHQRINLFHREEIDVLLHCLNEKEKKIVVLRLFQKRTFKEISEILALNSSTVYSLYKKALVKLENKKDVRTHL